MASAELGGLGDTEGAPATYHWTRPSPLPVVLPWLAILALLLLPANRYGRAWWVLAPLALIALLSSLPATAFSSLPSGLVDGLLQPAGVLGFGLAATWLLAPWAARGHRFVNGLCFGGILLASSALTQLMQEIGNDGVGFELLQYGIILGFGVCVLTVSLYVAGWLCRRRYSRARFAAWFALALVGVALFLVTPFFCLTVLINQGRAALWQLLAATLVVAGFCGVVALPFLALAFVNRFYRQRFEALLRLGPPPPVMPPPPPAVVVETSQA